MDPIIDMEMDEEDQMSQEEPEYGEENETFQEDN